MVYDGSGGKAFKADIGIKGDTIAFVGDLSNEHASNEINAKGLVVTPGFINIQSSAAISLIEDGRAVSDITQGVTLEVFGEGESEGPFTNEMQKEEDDTEGNFKYSVKWHSIKDFLLYLQQHGISPNVASFVGATTIRRYVLGRSARQPDSSQLQQMKLLVKRSMEDGAMGIGSALIYAPAFYAKTNELVEICKAAAPYGGSYISHIRSESNQLLEAADELITISKQAGIPAIFYHLKAEGKNNWFKMDRLIAKIDSARNTGLNISACMYTYIAGATGLDASMPPWVQEGGLDSWVRRLKDPSIRKKVIKEMIKPTNAWENLSLAAGPHGILFTSFRQDSLKYLNGKRLDEIAARRHKSPAETMIELVIEDHSRVETTYFHMTESNVKKELRLPYVSLGSDAVSLAPEGETLKSSTHPRAYGNFARFLGKYVRDEKLLPLTQAIHKITGLPAAQLKLKKRGLLKVGYYADVVVFDSATIQDHATYEKPHQLSTGVSFVLVNGTPVLKNGQPTGAHAGRAVFGPGYRATISPNENK
jgi:N-acyl-D-amino-acid deacylase